MGRRVGSRIGHGGRSGADRLGAFEPGRGKSHAGFCPSCGTNITFAQFCRCADHQRFVASPLMAAPWLPFFGKVTRRLRYELFQAPRGQGRPIAREAWEKMYREGAWDRLNDFNELGHYAVIAGYVRALSETATVWDIGCGHGRLLQLLQPHFSSYIGVDISAEAIARAIALQIPRTTFEVSRFEDWSPRAKADMIIFNESITYTTRPSELVLTYANRLNPGGRIIISLVEYGNHRAAWRRIDEVVDLVSGVRIENELGQAWNVRMFRADTASTRG